MLTFPTAISFVLAADVHTEICNSFSSLSAADRYKKFAFHLEHNKIAFSVNIDFYKFNYQLHSEFSS